MSKHRRSISILIPLAILGIAILASLLLPVQRPLDIQKNKQEALPQALPMRTLSDARGVKAIEESARAIVFVDSPYSVPAKYNSYLFGEGIALIREKRPGLRANVFVIESDMDEWCKNWITSLGVNELWEVALPAGNGAILWLEHGKVVQFQLGYQIKGGAEIRDATLKLW